MMRASCPRPFAQVFLSATLANASEFAHWIATLHSQPCHVVYTDYRCVCVSVWVGVGVGV